MFKIRLQIQIFMEVALSKQGESVATLAYTDNMADQNCVRASLPRVLDGI